jgi:hypothetical protein
MVFMRDNCFAVNPFLEPLACSSAIPPAGAVTTSAIAQVPAAGQSLHDHAAARGAEIHAKYGPRLGWSELQRLLQDRTCVRYPCEIVFGAGGLRAGELAHPAPKAQRPEAGFVMWVHPALQELPDQAVAVVLYQLVVINYGGFAAPADAEAFGANALGLSVEAYYERLCAIADRVGAPPAEARLAGAGELSEST